MKKRASQAQGETAGKGQASAVETALAAIAAHNEALGAFNVVLAEEARAAARAGTRGALAELPIGVKDIIDVAGVPTRAGSLTRKDARPAERDAFVVARLRAAGAVVVGKTNTVEYAFGGWGTNQSVGTPRNPWDRKVHRTPGGSSSGSGAAVGAGLVPAALGSDTGGSVRVPAAWCGCVGLKTSIGLIGRTGVVPLSTTLDTIGPLTDSVRRSAELLAVMQGEDPDDPATHGVTRGCPLRDLERGVAGLRLGVIGDDDLAGADRDARAALKRGAELLTGAGARSEPFKLPETPEAMLARCGALISVEAYATYRALADNPRSELSAPIRSRLKDGAGVSGADLIAGESERRRLRERFLAALDRLDAILIPAVPHPAIPLEDVDERRSPGLYTRFVNYLELAGLSVPIDVTAGGLPTAVQIVVRRLDDPLALRIGHALEAARGPFPRPRL